MVAPLLGAMVIWSVVAVGGVYEWAGVPLMIAAVLLAIASRSWLALSDDARVLDGCLIASIVAVGAQLMPLPAAVLAIASPHANEIRAALYLQPPTTAWQPISIDPASTAYALGLLGAALVVFWAARRACTLGMTRRIIRLVAFTGLAAAFAAIAFHASGDPTLIYGRFHPLDAGARPFGPFVNRNHFATWALMACPLAAGYLMAGLAARKPSDRLTGTLVAFFHWLGTSAAWVGAAAAVMTLALVISTSRSGIFALAATLAVTTWLVRRRLTRQIRTSSVIVLVALAAIVAAFVNVEPLLLRVDETIAVGAGGRPEIWQETLRLVRQFWLTGAGLGGYQSAMLVSQQANRSVFINQAHNQYLHLLAEGGVLVAAPVLCAAAAFIRLFAKRLSRDRSSLVWLRIGGGAAILAVALQGLWETGLRIPANGVLFAIAAAIALHEPGESRNPRE
jgi:O-antigen ligase